MPEYLKVRVVHISIHNVSHDTNSHQVCNWPLKVYPATVASNTEPPDDYYCIYLRMIIHIEPLQLLESLLCILKHLITHHHESQCHWPLL